MTSRDTALRQQATAELRRMVRGGPATEGRTSAFVELVAREPRGLNRLLTDLALDPDVDEAMRVKAVAALGRNTLPSSLAGLREAVEAEDRAVRQRAIERLGKVGTPADLERLKQVRTGNRVTQRLLRAAKCFLSYRHGLGEYRFDAPRRTFGAEPEQAVPIGVSPLTPAAVVRLAEAPKVLRGLEVSLERAVRLECGANEYVLAATVEHAASGMLAVTERQTLAATLLRWNYESGEHEPAYRFVTDPAGRGRFHIFGVRGTGRVALYGMGAVEDGVVRFDVRAAESPLEPPVTVAGTYTPATGVFDVEIAASEPSLAAAQRHLRKAPKAQGAPMR